MNEIAERCDFNTSDCINNRYYIEKELGQGAFGTVYKVKDRDCGQIRALKLFRFWTLLPKLRDAMATRFKMEFETGQIQSNYLVHSFESGYVKGNPFIVMEFCSNGDLYQWVNNKKVDFVKIGKEILHGLNDLHRCGKVHRDLKPENVLIKADGVAALTDFGISGDRKKQVTVTDIFGRPTEIAGSIPYMAPEQAKPKNRDVTVLPTMDIFAFGVMMYHLITDNYPFGQLNDENDIVLYLKNAREGNWNQNLLSKFSEGRKFDKVISGCLIPDFKQRLQTVDMVLGLLPQSAGISYEDAKHNIQYDIVNGILLRIMQGEEHGAVYKLNELLQGKSKIITMGCKDPSANNTLPITEEFTRFISRKHCTLELYSENKWFIRDGQWDRNTTNGWKNSLNGTFVNSTEVSSHGAPIKLGDIITIGDVKLRVEGY